MSDRTEAGRAADRYHATLDILIARSREVTEALERGHNIKVRTAGKLDNLPMHTDAASEAIDAVLNLGRNTPIRQLLEYASEADIALRLGV